MTDEEIEEIGGLTQEAATLAHDIAPALVQLGRRALDGDERALAALWDARDALQRVRDRVVRERECAKIRALLG